jgi:hypothetical protein
MGVLLTFRTECSLFTLITNALFDDYVTSSPGYAGKVLVVVWPAGASITETYIWRDGHIDKVPIETNEPKEGRFTHEEVGLG